jgi:hypothetical protein
MPLGTQKLLGTELGPRSAAASILALQRTAGNAAVHRALGTGLIEPITVHGDPSTVSSLGGAFSVHGTADGTFDGGTGKMVNQKATPSKACTDCPEGQCKHVTGTLMVTYHVDVTVTMPDVPDGLNACEEAKVRQFINTTLRDHENEHVRRFKTYNGTKAIPINITACGESDATDKVQALHDADEQKRQSDAQALSDAIDPFTKSIDLSKCQE